MSTDELSNGSILDSDTPVEVFSDDIVSAIELANIKLEVVDGVIVSNSINIISLLETAIVDSLLIACVEAAIELGNVILDVITGDLKLVR